MKNLAAISSDESIILFLSTLEWSLAQFFCNDGFHDALIFFFFYYLFQNERSDKHYPPPHVCFCLLFIWNGPLIQVLIKNQVQFAYFLVFYLSLWFKLSIFISFVLFSERIHKERREQLAWKKINVNRQIFKDLICIF